MKLETVRIAAPDVPGGYIVINKSDLTDEHTLYEEPKQDEQPKFADFGYIDTSKLVANEFALGGTVPVDLRVTLAGDQLNPHHNFIDPHAKFDDSFAITSADTKPTDTAQAPEGSAAPITATAPAGATAPADTATTAPATEAPAAAPAPAPTQSAMTVAQLKEALTAKGIAFPSTATRPQLQALLPK